MGLFISIHALLAESDKSYRHNGRNQNNISIHALLAESDSARKVAAVRAYKISIHALLAESDLLLCLFLRFLSRISIHALLAESDRHRAAPTRPGWAFLSTLSLRRATTRGQGAPLGIPYFYPRSPCGERRAAYSQWTPPIYFYPRSPCGERLDSILAGVNELLISIHALLAESDHGSTSL